VGRRIVLTVVAPVFIFAGLASRPQLLQAWPPLDAATTVQLPTFGVAIDADGLLSLKTFADPTGQLRAARIQAAKGRLAANLQARSPLRKISLVRLEAALRRAQQDGKKPDDAMLYLAGLQRVQYVFYFPGEHDIVIAGPAEGFAPDLSGRVCGVTTGRPTLRLDDLAVALRAFPPGAPPTPLVGCTIDPTQEAMTQLQAFQKTVPRVVPENNRAEVGQRIADGLRTALGTAPIRVFGIAPQTHCAAVMVEADYRMKLIGLGLEQPPVKITSYFELAGGARQGILQRWWFTPNYDCVRVSPDHQAMELVGEGVQLLTEAKLIAAGGELKGTSMNNGASETFCRGFTRKFPELAQRSPVYAELRNTVDLLVAAAYIQQQGFADQAAWKMTTFKSEQNFAVETEPAPKQVACAVNAEWRGSRFVAVAGGGVSISAAKALTPDRLLPDKDGKLGTLRDEVSKTEATKQAPADRWWWD
jgi:hypothetical protein